LAQACREGAVDLVVHLLEKSPGLLNETVDTVEIEDEVDGGGLQEAVTPLQIAVHGKQWAVVHALLRHKGIDVDKVGGCEWESPLNALLYDLEKNVVVPEQEQEAVLGVVQHFLDAGAHPLHNPKDSEIWVPGPLFQAVDAFSGLACPDLSGAVWPVSEEKFSGLVAFHLDLLRMLIGATRNLPADDPIQSTPAWAWDLEDQQYSFREAMKVMDEGCHAHLVIPEVMKQTGLPCPSGSLSELLCFFLVVEGLELPWLEKFTTDFPAAQAIRLDTLLSKGPSTGLRSRL
jgi:hypothetical protein